MAKTNKKTAINEEQNFEFQAEVSRLLDIVTNALYSNKDVFLRELISNASDACDRLRYEALTNTKLSNNADFSIHIKTSVENNTLTITDNGIGMNRDELIANLGTIASSGTAKMMEQIKAAKGDLSLIGQFGVGFYASFMVADKVDVLTKKAGEKDALLWSSDGQSGYSIQPATKEEHGTIITLHLKKDSRTYLEEEILRRIIETYSEHVSIPVFMNKDEQAVNEGGALWTQPKSNITKEQYTEFYQSVTHGFDQPALTSHWKAEGIIEYTALLFLPSMRPFDLYDPSRAHHVKLYVKRVFITDDCEGLVYPWLRFVRGVIDSSDLPLNISREMLQTNPVVNKIRQGITKRILSDLAKLADKEPETFNTAWETFGAVIKEGLYDAVEHREAILNLCRFKSTDDLDNTISLKQYKEKMPENQKDIYYISGDSIASVKNAPQLEGFKARGINVLFMTDTVDEFWLQHNLSYDGLNFKSVTRAGADLEDLGTTEDKSEEKTKTDDKEFDVLLAKLQQILVNDVHSVTLSKRLQDSPVCFVAREGQADFQMEKVMKIQQKVDLHNNPILEINPKHPLIKSLAEQGDKVDEDSLWLLFDQARILQGQAPKDPTAFTKRLNKLMGS